MRVSIVNHKMEDNHSLCCSTSAQGKTTLFRPALKMRCWSGSRPLRMLRYVVHVYMYYSVLSRV